jgi:methylated-DNA-[protein]-cysteine S-methyltransferase
MGGVTGEAGLRALELPHRPPDQIEQLLAWNHPHAVRDDRPFARLIELSRAYFNGRAVDFGELACDLPPERAFSGQVLRACREIPYGQTVSYGDLARRIGRGDAARAVAAAMGRNPLPLVVPCHRVVYGDGRLGGFSAAGGAQLKQRMLELETARCTAG